MKTKITKLVLIAFALVKSLTLALPAKANYPIGQTVAVKFAHNVTTQGLENGTGIALEIMHDIFDANGNKIFAQGGSGYAYVDNLKKSSFLGRGAKLNITRGVLIDVQGRAHDIALSANAKGDMRLSSAAGALMGGASAFEAWEGVGTATGAIFATGLTLVPIAFLMRKGNEATLPRGMVVFATLLS